MKFNIDRIIFRVQFEYLLHNKQEQESARYNAMEVSYVL